MKQTGILGILVVGLLVIASCVPSPSTQQPPSTSASQETAVPTTGQVEAIPTSGVMEVEPTPGQAAATDVPVQVTGMDASPSTGIALSEPEPGTAITSPVHVRGEARITPFESTLRGRVYDAQGQVLGEMPILLDSEMGSPGTFDALIPFSAAADGSGTVEIADLSPKDGSILESSSIAVEVRAGTPIGTIEIPSSGQRVVLPLRILARVGHPGDVIRATLLWSDGTELAQTFATVTGEDGRGLLIASLNWPGESQPPEPPSQSASMELRDELGGLLAQQDLVVLSAADPDTQAITLYFLLGEDIHPVTRRIPKAGAIGAAVLEELLWGPPAPNLAGFGTALPTSQEVLDYAGREPGWGPRVTLKSLTIADGIALADFSKEMRAYGGGSLRVSLLRWQIEMTLKQFASVQQVIISVEGETEEVLQP
jgi:hypothetical protein